MPLPSAISMVTVTGSWFDAQGNALEGTVTFTPNARLVSTSQNVVVPRVTVSVPVSAGTLPPGFALAATDDSDLSPLGYSYLVVETVGGVVDSYYIQLLSANTPIDLADLTHLSSAPSMSSGDVTSVDSMTGAVVLGNRVATSTYAAKGTVLGGTGAGTYAGLAVGTNGKVLSADSTASTGLAWVAAGGTPADADASTKGIVQLAGDLGGTAAAPTVPALTAKAADSAVVHNTGTENVDGAKTLLKRLVINEDGAGKATLATPSTSGQTGWTAGGDTNWYRSSADTWTTDDSVIVTGTLTAGGERVGGSLWAVKAADQALTVSSTTLQDVTDLIVTVVAGASYEISGLWAYTGPSTGDVQFALSTTGFTPTALHWVATGLDTGTASGQNFGSIKVGKVSSSGGATSLGATGTGTPVVAVPKGLLVVGGTGGTIKLRAAQATSDTTATTILANSFLCLRRVA